MMSLQRALWEEGAQYKSRHFEALADAQNVRRVAEQI